MSHNDTASVTQSLVGKTLTSVGFIDDSLLLGFDEIELTTPLWPTVARKDSLFTYGMLEYRNELCDTIGSDVTDIQMQPDTLSLSFGTTEFRLPLRSLQKEAAKLRLKIANCFITL